MKLQIDSVASVFDIDTKMVYAKYQHGGFDVESGIHIDNLSEKFVSFISEEDLILINQYVGIIK